jgi:branched-chain amino acid transport system ATP-binding protein
VSLLALAGLSAHYGRGPVLHGVSLDVAAAGVSVVLGANGAGKTTLLRAVCGMIAREGAVVFDGARIDRLATADVARLGIAHVPEGRGTFPNLSTEENLRLGACSRRGPRDRRVLESVFERVYQYFPKLAQRRRQQAGTLSGGEQQMLAVGRALMSSPKLMLLDEPSFGLAPLVVEELYRIMRDINAHEHVGILLVEQNAAIALDLADCVYLFETGRVVMTGPPKDLRGDESLRRVYLGY